MPFKLIFGVKDVIPIEISLPLHKVESFNEQKNFDHLHSKLDLLEEIRERAQIRMTSYQLRMAHYYNSRVKLKSFNCGDLILCRAKVSKPTK